MAEQMPSIGRAVHYVLPDGPAGDDHRAATIVRVWPGDVVNLQIMLDCGPNGRGNDTGYVSSLIWKTSVRYDADGAPNTWHWPEFVPPRAA